MRTTRNIVRPAMFAAILLVIASFTAPANAQSELPQEAFQGKFTLPYEVHWGNALLPAGDYVFGFTQSQTPANIWIRDAKTLRSVAFEPTGIRQDGKGDSALLVSVRGRQHVVCSLTIAEIGETFVYQCPSARGHETEEVRQTQTVPILLAQK
jgi:hypothetical protein